jgi:alkanesulfonate monooxygenase SsuD/methylene tetrahydromethanopterin reductase-like flavin-dependent oxidoreductase (luciferase family)
MRLRIGLSVMPLETRREAIIGLATEGNRLGYDGFFLPETWAYDITVLLAEAAARTTRITLGTGILGIWNRSAATIAGTPPEARRRLGRWHEAGAAFPVLLLRPDLALEERALTLDAFRPMLLI